VRRPDGTQEEIEDVLSSPGGFYGQDVRMDQAGIWEVWASWAGNERLLGATSPVITVPVQTDIGRAILLAGGQDSNRDVFWRANRALPLDRVLCFGQVKLGLTHGHGGLWEYLFQKLRYHRRGYRSPGFLQRMARRFPPDVDVIVFGHTHHSLVRYFEGCLFVNPGAVAPGHFDGGGARLALLHLAGGAARAELLRV